MFFLIFRNQKKIKMISGLIKVLQELMYFGRYLKNLK